MSNTFQQKKNPQQASSTIEKQSEFSFYFTKGNGPSKKKKVIREKAKNGFTLL